MGKTFAKIKLCHTNDFPPDKNEGIKKWVTNNGGTFQQDIDTDTTHLVCSTKAWKRYDPKVKEARRRNRTLPRKKKIRIVNYEWLEESLTSKARRPKETTKYEWEQKKIGRKPAPTTQAPCIGQTDKATPAEAKLEKVDRKMLEFNKEIEEFEAAMETEGYHPYVDTTGFIYLVVLVRRDIEKNLIERHKIKLFESDAMPRKYACYLSYTAGRPGVKRETQVLAPANSDWPFAWGMFTKVFKLKTSVEWDARPEGIDAGDLSSLKIDGGTIELPTKFFQYTAPKAGLPQGVRYSSEYTDGPTTEGSTIEDEKDTPSQNRTGSKALKGWKASRRANEGQTCRW